MWTPPWVSNRLSGVTDNAAFRRWFRYSTITDEDLTPLVVFHGGADIANLPKRQFRVGRGLGKWGAGIYFTPDRWRAKDYAERNEGVVGGYYLRVENPLVLYESQAYRDDTADLIRRVREEGLNDGLIIVQSDFGKPARLKWNVTEIVVFDPRQIKSVDNVGTYDPDDPDILNGF